MAEIFLDDVESDENRLIPWYLLVAYARAEREIELMPEIHIHRLEERICKYFEHMTHKHKEYIRVIDAGEFFDKSIKVEEYPKDIHDTLDLILEMWDKIETTK